MTELASMAAYKNTNNSNSNTITTPSLIQPNSPALSTTSSLVSPDSSATNPISSPDSQTPQNTPITNSPMTPLVQASGSGCSTLTAPSLDESNLDLSTSTTPTNQAPDEADNNKTLSLETSNRDSPIIDTKSTGSVLDKASMFEKKLEEQQPQVASILHHAITLPSAMNSTLNLTPATVARLESIYGKKTEEIYNKTAAGLLVDRVDTGTG